MLIQLKLDNTDLYKKIRKAMEILEKYKNWNYKYVFFSGGKDSLVALDLTSKVWKNFTIVYVEVTGNTHPECTKYVYKIVNEYNADFVHVKTEKYEFFECLKKWGYPSLLWSHSNRWCLTHFKDEPIVTLTKGRGVGVSGVSPYNSVRRHFILRHARPILLAPRRSKWQWTYYSLLPLFYFDKNDIWQYILENNLPLNPLYRYIGSSGNCVICPAMRKEQLLAIKRECFEFFCKWKKAHEKLRRDFALGKLKGMKVTFYKFEQFYNNIKSS